jgi:hypothetical protein
MPSFTQMSAMLINPHTVTGTLYANQQLQSAANRVIYTTEGNQSSTSENLTYDGETLAVAGDLNVEGTTQLTGSTNIAGRIGHTGDFFNFGTVALADYANPFASNTSGPLMYYRTAEQPVIWTGTVVINSQNAVGGFTTGLIPVDGPYIGPTPARTTGIAVNGNPPANVPFYVYGMQILNAAGLTVGAGEQIKNLRFRCSGDNTNPAQINFTIFFQPPV